MGRAGSPRPPQHVGKAHHRLRTGWGILLAPAGPAMVCGIISSERGCGRAEESGPHALKPGLLGCVRFGLGSVQPGPATLGPRSAGPSLLAAQATSPPRPNVLSDETTNPDPQSRVAGSVLCLYSSGWSATARRPEPGAEALGHSPSLVFRGTRSVIKARKPSAISL